MSYEFFVILSIAKDLNASTKLLFPFHSRKTVNPVHKPNHNPFKFNLFHLTNPYKNKHITTTFSSPLPSHVVPVSLSVSHSAASVPP